jgi:hypothetical protein
MSTLERNMKKILLPLVLASFGLAGCVAVPVNEGYGGGYAPARPVYVAPPAIAPVVVVRPWFYGYYAGGHGGHRYH